jgi:hypothetical protein
VSIDTFIAPVTSPIKSIQRGTITIAASATTGTATITSVDTAKSMCLFLGFTTTWDFASADNWRASRLFPRVALTNGTTVTATRNSSDSTATVTVSYEVIEYN